MKRSEFWEWMNTCPNKDWFQAADDGGGIRIYFPVDEDPEEGEENEKKKSIGEIMSLKYKMEAKKN